MTNMSSVIASVPVFIFCLSGTSTILAQDYPSRPIKYIVADAPGTTGDTIGRILAPEMTKAIGQPVIIENKPGAGNRIGFEYVAKLQPADGYTFAAVTVETLALLPVTAKNIPFDPLKDLPPFMVIGDARLVFASSSSSTWKNFAELVANIKANPGKLNYGASAPVVRFPMEALIGALGVNVVHIPYATAASFTQSLVAGDIQMGFVGELPARALGGKLRVLAVTGDQRRAPFLDVPTFVELGHPQIPDVSYSFNARDGTPKSATDKLYMAAQQALKLPEVRASFEKIGFNVNEKPAGAAVNMLAQRAKLFAEIAKRVGVQPE